MKLMHNIINLKSPKPCLINCNLKTHVVREGIKSRMGKPTEKTDLN